MKKAGKTSLEQKQLGTGIWQGTLAKMSPVSNAPSLPIKKHKPMVKEPGIFFHLHPTKCCGIGTSKGIRATPLISGSVVSDQMTWVKGINSITFQSHGGAQFSPPSPAVAPNPPACPGRASPPVTGSRKAQDPPSFHRIRDI